MLLANGTQFIAVYDIHENVNSPSLTQSEITEAENGIMKKIFALARNKDQKR
jgi:hypothetical protein